MRTMAPIVAPRKRPVCRGKGLGSTIHALLGAAKDSASYMEPADKAVAVFRGSVSSASGLLGVSLSHLALVCGKCGQNLAFLRFGHVEVIE